MDITDIDDDRIRALLSEELDRREKEKQKLCYHRKSGTFIDMYTVKCDECGKIMGDYEKENAFAGMETPPLSPVEQKLTGKE